MPTPDREDDPTPWRNYVPASFESGRSGTRDFVAWWLDLPAIVALFMALALFSLLYAALASVEKGLATVSGVDDGRPQARGPR